MNVNQAVDDGVPDAKRLCAIESENQEDVVRNEASAASKLNTLEMRKTYIAPSIKYYYPESPLKIARGEGQYLFDEKGRKYLDCVNNVAHVGHCHPKVVSAGVKQMALLSTNNRYLHDGICSYARHLERKMPGDLSKFYFMNTGSEANDLALRIAREVTGHKEIICLDGAYHGHLSSLMEISSHKWKGNIEKWKGEHTILAPPPNTYRGLYCDPEKAGELYAEEIKKLIDEAHSKGNKIAAFIHESAPSSDGLYMLPKGFLKAVYRYVREVGGMCIADEVQVGFGRCGTHFWMFQTQDVIPDIVTVGKPMGNGHPVAALVTTQKIADLHQSVASSYFCTFGGNPVSMAIADAVLTVIEDQKLQQHALEVGSYLLARFKELQSQFPQWIGDVRGQGLFIGVEMVKDCITKESNTELALHIHKRLKNDYCIILTTDGPYDCVMKFKAPMVFTKDNANYLVKSMEEILQDYKGNNCQVQT